MRSWFQRLRCQHTEHLIEIIDRREWHFMCSKCGRIRVEERDE